ncbi:outer membrane beta-barrel protein [Chitinophaga filiformis]|uniref:Outer membrane protein beta-barrel domain-containing protein n=1 Tax=Chitinophaga filiformis TaxID=104663 RepID=A0A1G7RKW4_CHIFI|nr:outer membrane beta-barrel protein [Chitinophaga filiformis]SDG11345.1 Outer membrane protein beta-barrel domain-containing protein [Chitinophaga filiformis]
MKKIILLALLAVSIMPAFAQTSIGVIGGYNLSSITPKLYGYDVTSRSGWRAGLIADRRLWSKFYLQPQLVLNKKGYNYAFYNSETGISGKTERQLLYAELQAIMLFKQQFHGGKLFAGAGAYIGRGIDGSERSKNHYELNGSPVTSTTHYDVKYRNNEPEYIPGSEVKRYVKPYDAGLNFLAGYELKNGLFFNATYSLGLTELGHWGGWNSRNTYWGLSVGCFLKKFS